MDYKSTVFLPRTDFPMRANLPEREPALLERWRDQNATITVRSDAITIDLTGFPIYTRSV